jgi:hypothetical protein
MSPQEIIAREIDPKAWARLAQERLDFPADPTERFKDAPSLEKARNILIALHNAGYIIDLVYTSEKNMRYIKTAEGKVNGA